MRLLAFIGVVFFLLTATAGAKQKPWQYRYEVFTPPHYIRLGQCESGAGQGNEPIWTHNSGIYEGAYGFYRGTWDQYKLPGYPARAYMANPYQQYRVAKRVHDKLGFRIPWGCWRGAGHAWVRGGLPEWGS